MRPTMHILIAELIAVGGSKSESLDVFAAAAEAPKSSVVHGL